MWLIIAISFSEWRERLAAGSEPRPAVSLAFPVSLGLGAIALALYVVFSMCYQPPLATVPAHPPRVIAAGTDVFRADRLKYTETLTGERQEPINFIFLARNDAQLAALLRQADWNTADPASVASLFKAVKALVLKKNTHGAPLTPSFWNLKVQDLSFAKVSGENWLCHALHLRIWRTDFQMAGGGRVYAAMANGVDHCQWGVIPRIDPNLDRSRDTLLHQLTATGKIGHDQKISVVSPMIGENFLGDQFFSVPAVPSHGGYDTLHAWEHRNMPKHHGGRITPARRKIPRSIVCLSIISTTSSRSTMNDSLGTTAITGRSCRKWSAPF